MIKEVIKKNIIINFILQEIYCAVKLKKEELMNESGKIQHD